MPSTPDRLLAALARYVSEATPQARSSLRLRWSRIGLASLALPAAPPIRVVEGRRTRLAHRCAVCGSRTYSRVAAGRPPSTCGREPCVRLRRIAVDVVGRQLARVDSDVRRGSRSADRMRQAVPWRDLWAALECEFDAPG